MSAVVKEPFDVILKRFLETLPIYMIVSYSKDIEIVMGFHDLSNTLTFEVLHEGFQMCRFEIENTRNFDNAFEIVTQNLSKSMIEYTLKVNHTNIAVQELLTNPNLENTWTRRRPIR